VLILFGGGLPPLYVEQLRGGLTDLALKGLPHGHSGERGQMKNWNMKVEHTKVSPPVKICQSVRTFSTNA
jgi:hypothetical protein